MFKSVDNGANWTVLNVGDALRTLSSFVVSGATLLAGTDQGIFKSPDDGATWSTSIAGLDVSCFAVKRTDIFAGIKNGGDVYKSVNGGGNWIKLNTSFFASQVFSLAVKNSTIFAGTDGGVFRSIDNGATWTSSVGSTSWFVTSLVVDGNNLYAGAGVTRPGGVFGVFMSADDGANWTDVSLALVNTSINSLTVIGTDLYAGTDGRGVWSRPLSDFTVVNTQGPTITNKTTATVQQGSAIAVTAAISSASSTVSSANVLYRYIAAGGNFISLPLTQAAAGQDYVQTLPATTLSDLGVEYKFDVTDAKGQKNVQQLFTVRVTTNGLTIPYASAGSDVSNYRIVAIPLELTDKSAGGVFDELGTADNTKWRMFHYQNGANQELSASSSINAGSGYWLLSKTVPPVINSGAGVTVAASSQIPYAIDLVAGWNQIGNPYNFNLSWADVQAANSGLPGLRKYDGNFVDATRLNSMEGGFINVPAAGKLVFPVIKNSTVNGRVAQETMPFRNALTETNWQVYLLANQGTNTNTNRIAGFGMHEKASEGYDPYDGFTMPRFFNRWLEVNHTKKDQGQFYSKDIVPVSQNHVWEFSVATSSDEPEITFSWDNSYFGATGPALYLWDDAQQLAIDMRSQTKYTFSKGNATTFRVVYGTTDYVKEQTQVRTMVLHAVWPNPADEAGVITIPFSVLEQGSGQAVTVMVTDMMGRQVWTHSATYTNGYHELQWVTAVKEAGGLYMIVVRAGTTARQAKVVIK